MALGARFAALLGGCAFREVQIASIEKGKESRDFNGKSEEKVEISIVK